MVYSHIFPKDGHWTRSFWFYFRGLRRNPMMILTVSLNPQWAILDYSQITGITFECPSSYEDQKKQLRYQFNPNVATSGTRSPTSKISSKQPWFWQEKKADKAAGLFRKDCDGIRNLLERVRSQLVNLSSSTRIKGSQSYGDIPDNWMRYSAPHHWAGFVLVGDSRGNGIHFAC